MGHVPKREREYEPRTLGWWMNERRGQLGLSWAQVAALAGVTTTTLRRKSDDPSGMNTTTEQGIERALSWGRGSVRAILSGSKPTPLPEPEREPVVVVRDPETGQIDPAQAVRRLLQLVPSIRENAGPERAREQFRLAWEIAVDTGVLNQVSDELAATQKAL